MPNIHNLFQFSYYLASYSSFKFASFGIVSGVPFLGFGPLPPYKTNIIDFHGVLDDVIPYSVDSEEGSYGRGPDGLVSTVISYDGMYYYDKPEYAQFLGQFGHPVRSFILYFYTIKVGGFNCESGEEYQTDMDGVDGWQCIRSVLTASSQHL